MKHNRTAHEANQNSTNASHPNPAANPPQNDVDFAASADEVARKAYFSYVNEGSPEGRHVQHWLKAEADLLAERNRTRIHGFHNQT